VYNIKHNKNLNILEIENAKKNVFAKVHLKYGASLQELTLNGHAIIQNLAPLTYGASYASSILFPFANRIKDGIYNYEGKVYTLETNQKEENNALHGLVYNKTFKILEHKTNDESAVITLEYNEHKKKPGFPYTYSIILTYTFTQNNMSLKVSIKNTDSKTFPFTLGWHPYFVSENLYESTLQFDTTEKLIIGNRNITTGTETIKPIEKFQIKNKQLDDCWILNSNAIKFKTPKYDLVINSSVENNFLQVYTPPNKNTLAIEPTTGVSDSFNNNIGLQYLKPNQSYTITWGLNIN